MSEHDGIAGGVCFAPIADTAPTRHASTTIVPTNAGCRNLNISRSSLHHPGVGYRADIDGLRALAILPVVWFHSDLPGLPGGFTGVDTFFVISGYLITLIIHREVQAGSFSFARFYERRVRRIAPALLLVTASATIAAYALLLPYELEQYSASGLAALGMVSNFYFWRTGSYYGRHAGGFGL